MRITVIGLGLIGGSALLAMRRAGHALTGFDADPGTRQLAATNQVQVAASVSLAVEHAELVVLAVPLPALGGVLDQLAEVGYAGLVTDVTSVKQPVAELVARHLTGRTKARFVGGHPMAGKETSGFAVADPDLFEGATWVLCAEVDPETQLPGPPGRTVAELVHQVGARVVWATPEEHDRAVAVISHVPHLLAAALACRAGQDQLGLQLAAGSFRDGTRVAATRPALTAAMCGGNHAAVATALDAVLAELAAARAALDDPDPIRALTSWLEPGYRARVAWEELRQPVAGRCGETAPD